MPKGLELKNLSSSEKSLSPEKSSSDQTSRNLFANATQHKPEITGGNHPFDTLQQNTEDAKTNQKVIDNVYKPLGASTSEKRKETTEILEQTTSKKIMREASTNLFDQVANTEIILAANKNLSDRFGDKKIILGEEWSLDGLLEEGQTKQNESLDILGAVAETLQKGASEVDKLVSWNRDDYFQNLKDRWPGENPGAPQETRESIDSPITVIEVEMSKLEAYWKELLPLQQAIYAMHDIIHDALSKIPSNDSITKHHDRLKTIIKCKADANREEALLQNLRGQSATWQHLDQSKMELLGQAISMRARIDASLDGPKRALETASEIRDALKELGVQGWKEEQKKSQDMLEAIGETLQQRASELDTLASWKVEDYFQDQTKRWVSENLGVPQGSKESFQSFIKKTTIGLENHRDALDQLKNDIGTVITNLGSVPIWTPTYYKELRSKATTSYDRIVRGYLGHIFDKQYGIWTEINQNREEFVEDAKSLSDKVKNISNETRKILQEATRNYRPT